MGIQVPPDSTGKIVETILLTDHRQVIILGGDGAVAERAAVRNAGPVAATYGLSTRNVPRREGAVLSTATLGISGVFTQAWQDGNADGVLQVEAVARADVASASNGFVIQETDDDTDANFTRTVAQRSVAANTTIFLYAAIRGRKWRVQYTNGGTAQTSFKLTAAAGVHPSYPTDIDGQLLVDVIDRDARLAGRLKVLDSTGTVIDPATKGQLPAALVGGRLDVNLGASGITLAVDSELEAAVALGDTMGNLTVPRVGGAILGFDGTNYVRIRSATGAPGGTEQGLIVRNIPSGTQVVDTELPAAAALADAAPNPTTPLIGAAGLLYNGATWDRVRGDTTFGVDIDPTRPPANRVASGALGALNAAVTINGEGTGVVHWEIDTGTLVGTVVFEATLDDTNWFAINAIRINGTIIASTSSFADRGAVDAAGYSQLRLRVSAFTSGTSNARLEASAGGTIVRLSQAIPIGANRIGKITVRNAADSADIDPLAEGTFTGRINTQGQKAMAASTPVVLPSDQSAIPITDSSLDNATLVDNAAFTDGTTRLMMAGYIFDETAGTALTENDAAASRIDSKRALILVIEDATTRGQRAAVSAGGQLSIQIGAETTNRIEVQGDVAHGVAVGGNPVLLGVEARTTSPTAVSSGQAVRLTADTLGKLITLPFANPENFVEGSATLTTTTDTSIIAAPGVAIRNYITEVTGSNTSATAVRLDVKDGVTVKRSFFLAASGGGFVWQSPSFIIKQTANTALQMALGAAVTDVRVGASGYTAP